MRPAAKRRIDEELKYRMQKDTHRPCWRDLGSQRVKYRRQRSRFAGCGMGGGRRRYVVVCARKGGFGSEVALSSTARVRAPSLAKFVPRGPRTNQDSVRISDEAHSQRAPLSFFLAVTEQYKQPFHCSRCQLSASG